MELKNDCSDPVPGYGGENQENDRNMTADEKAGIEATFEVMGEDQGTVPTPQLTAAGTPVPVNWLKTAAIIFSGQIFSILSSVAAGYALIWYLTLTGSAMILVLGTVVYMLPVGLLSPFIGAIVDRHNRKFIMIAADIFMAVVTLVMILFIVLGFAGVPPVLAMIAVRSIGQTFHSSAFNAAMPLLVPEKHLVRIGSLTMAISAGTNIIGPAFGIVLFESMGLHIALLADVLGAIIGCSVLFFVTIPDIHLSKAEQTGVIRELVNGVGAIRATSGLTSFYILIAITCIFWMPMAALFPLMTVEHFGGGGFEAAAIEAVWGGGFLLGSIILGIWGGGKRLVRLIQITVLICAVITAVCGLLPMSGFWWFFVLTGLMAVIGAGFNTPMTVVVQKNMAPEKLGRALTVLGSLTSLASLIGLGLAGLFGDMTGVPFIFLASGVGMVVVIAASLFFPAVHHLDEPRRIGTDLSDIAADDNDDTVTARAEPTQRGKSEVPSVGGIRYVESQESRVWPSKRPM